MNSPLKILLFAPHSAIWVHAFPEAVTVEALQKSGHEIIYITCGGVLNEYCVCMSAYQLEQSSSELEKQKICDRCNIQKDIIKKSFNFQGYDLSEVITAQDRQDIQKILHTINPENFLNLKLDNIEIGRTALYELLLQYKKSNLDFSPAEWSNYLIALKNTLISFFACRRIIEKEQPDRVLSYNSLYSVNRICCQLAQLKNIPTYFLHAGGNLSNRLQTMMLGEGTTFKFNQRLLEYWKIYKDIPCSQDSLELVTNHFLELFKGQHFLAYSSAQSNKTVDIKKIFNINKDQKVLVATMSSYDERFAGEQINVIPTSDQLIFPKQVDWIQALIQFVSKRQDLCLIIRIHPREFPNKRDSVKSEHAQMLEQILKDLPINVKVNYPTDLISIYDLAKETDVFLNAWSSVGEEMSLLGIPVVIYSSDLIFYPPDLNYLASSKEDFFIKIDQALIDGWSFERVKKTYRWYVLKFERSVIDIAESYNSSSNSLKRKNIISRIFKKIYRKVICKFMLNSRKKVYYHEQYRDCNNREKFLKNTHKIHELIVKNKNFILSFDAIEIDGVMEKNEVEYLKKDYFNFRHKNN